MRAAILKPTKLAQALAPMFGRRAMPIMSVILEKGEKSVERQVLEAMVDTRDVYTVSVHTVADYEAAHRRYEAEQAVSA